MTTQYKAAIVGCGGIAQLHAEVLFELPDVKLSAVCDIRPGWAEALAEKFGGDVYFDYEDMLDSAEIDVLHICTPHYLHVDMAEKAVRRGIAVFTEKPPCITRAEAERFYALEGQGRVGICFQNRYNPCTLFAMETITKPEAGKILGGRAFVTWHRMPPYYTESDWRGRWETEGGSVLMNQSIHTLDLLLGFMGRPEKVRAMAANYHLEGFMEEEDTLAAYLAFPESSAVFFCTNAYTTDAPIMIEIHCEKLLLRLEDSRVTLRWADGKTDVKDFSEAPNSLKAYWGNGHKACIADFYHCLRENLPYKNDIASVRNIMDTVLDIYAMVRKGFA